MQDDQLEGTATTVRAPTHTHTHIPIPRDLRRLSPHMVMPSSVSLLRAHFGPRKGLGSEDKYPSCLMPQEDNSEACSPKSLKGVGG